MSDGRTIPHVGSLRCVQQDREAESPLSSVEFSVFIQKGVDNMEAFRHTEPWCLAC